MKKPYFKNFLIIVCLSTVYVYPSGDPGIPSYRGVFTRAIYEQGDVIREYEGTQELDRKIVERFNFLKEEMVRKKILNDIAEELGKLLTIQNKTLSAFIKKADIERQLAKVTFFSKLLKVIVNLIKMPFLVSTESNPVPIIGPIENIIDSFSEMANLPMETQLKLINITIDEIRAENPEIGRLQRKYNKFLSGVGEGLWHDLEEQYVIKKRLMHPDLCNSIENNFIGAHAVSGPTESFYRTFFEQAIALPITAKKLGNGDNVLIIALQFLDRFDRNEHFSVYDSKVRERLKKIILKVIALSHSEGKERPYLTRLIEFWGDPGTGKSRAATALAQFLDLPYLKPHIVDATDLARSAVEGGAFWSEGDSSGLLAQALTATDSKGNRYANSFLILEEYDKILDSSASITFLLNRFDPDCFVFKSPLFNCPVDISRVICCITGNRSVVQTSIRGAVTDVEVNHMNPLARRTDSVEFPQFTPEHKKKMIQENLRKLIAFYDVMLDEEQQKTIVDASSLDETVYEAGLKSQDYVLNHILNLYNKNFARRLIDRLCTCDVLVQAVFERARSNASPVDQVALCMHILESCKCVGDLAFVTENWLSDVKNNLGPRVEECACVARSHMPVAHRNQDLSIVLLGILKRCQKSHDDYIAQFKEVRAQKALFGDEDLTAYRAVFNATQHAGNMRQATYAWLTHAGLIECHTRGAATGAVAAAGGGVRHFTESLYEVGGPA